jgi:hypothetical protein
VAYQTITSYSDYENLQLITISKVLKKRQARLSQELAGQDFKIICWLGSKFRRLDALSRYLDNYPMKQCISNNYFQVITRVLNPDYFAQYDLKYNVSSFLIIQQHDCRKFLKSHLIMYCWNKLFLLITMT